MTQITCPECKRRCGEAITEEGFSGTIKLTEPVRLDSLVYDAPSVWKPSDRLLGQYIEGHVYVRNTSRERGVIGRKLCVLPECTVDVSPSKDVLRPSIVAHALQARLNDLCVNGDVSCVEGTITVEFDEKGARDLLARLS